MHDAGGLLYYDGANLNAILGKVRPGDMGFDAIHMNLHKTFSTPARRRRTGRGRGRRERAAAAVPADPDRRPEASATAGSPRADLPQSIGRLSAFMGNAGVLLRAYIYMRMLGRDGMREVGDYATLNANYLLTRLQRPASRPPIRSGARATSSS